MPARTCGAASRTSYRSTLAAAETKPRSRPRRPGALAIFAASWAFFGPVFAVVNDPGTSSLDRTVGSAVLISMGMMTCTVGLAVLTPFG